MQGLVSLLDKKHTKEIIKIQKNLKQALDLDDVNINPYPHFSWHVAERYDLKLVENIIKELALKMNTFTIKTAGLGIFTGKVPIVYLKIVCDLKLLNYHKQIFAEGLKASEGSVNYYSPGNWVPHITIAAGIVTKSTIDLAIKLLATQDLHWQITISNLSFLIEQDEQNFQLLHQFNFEK